MTWFRLDVTHEDSIEQLLENVSKLCAGSLDILLNNAYALIPLLNLNAANIKTPSSAGYVSAHKFGS
jgi:NAD(P)-dependent dehydrogenase (short-subunit alcohol dehydrogenase family)